MPMAPVHELFQSIIGSFQNILWGKVRLQNLTVACFLTGLSDELARLIVELIVDNVVNVDDVQGFCALVLVSTF